MATYTKMTAFMAAPEQLADLTKLRGLTGESLSGVIRRALDQLLRSELPYRLAELARKNATTPAIALERGQVSRALEPR